MPARAADPLRGPLRGRRGGPPPHRGAGSGVDTRMSWFCVFLGFCLLIILHEAGHFVAAKATGMRVERFFLFFGPTIWSFKRGETEYGVKAIPLGGYVKITGMNPEEEIPPEVEHRAYYRQPVWKRIVVIARRARRSTSSLAFVILFFVFLQLPQRDRHQTVGEDPAGHAGRGGARQPGDRIVAVDGDRYAGPRLRRRASNDFGNAGRLAQMRRQAGRRLPGGDPGDADDRARRRARRRSPSGPNTTGEAEAHPDRLRLRQRAARPRRRRSASSRAGDKMWVVTYETVHVFAHIFESEERKQISGDRRHQRRRPPDDRSGPRAGAASCSPWSASRWA